MSGWALVTGAARRIGRAIALDLAEHGWDIIVHYHRSASDAESLAEDIIEREGKVILAEIDLAQADHTAKLIPSLVAEIGPIAALVNNASIFERDADDPTGRLHHAVNAEAPRLLSEAFFRQIPETATGGIVNLLDGMPPEKDFKAYNQSKADLLAATVDMARRFAPRVRVNGIAPGPVLPSQRQSEQHFQQQIAATPLKTGISPAAIAGAVRFLLCSPSITGDILHVDGGMRLLQRTINFPVS